MSDKVVLVTGGASGIGFACARRFFNDGYKVVIADSNEAEGLRALDDLGVASDKQDAGTQAIFVHCDISDKLAVHNLVAEALTAKPLCVKWSKKLTIVMIDLASVSAPIALSICLPLMRMSPYRIIWPILFPKVVCGK